MNDAELAKIRKSLHDLRNDIFGAALRTAHLKREQKVRLAALREAISETRGSVPRWPRRA